MTCHPSPELRGRPRRGLPKPLKLSRQNRAGQPQCKSTSSQQVILNWNELVFRRGFLPNVGNLLAFEATARHGSVSRAAEELNLTQSAVSRQIQQLEESLGVSLFSRARQRVVLTDVGRMYASQVRSTLTELSDATHQAIALSGTSGVLNLATLPTFGTRWLIPRIPDFFALHPDATSISACASCPSISPPSPSMPPFISASRIGPAPCANF